MMPIVLRIPSFTFAPEEDFTARDPGLVVIGREPLGSLLGAPFKAGDAMVPRKHTRASQPPSRQDNTVVRPCVTAIGGVQTPQAPQTHSQYLTNENVTLRSGDDRYLGLKLSLTFERKVKTRARKLNTA